jgi:hypothetical protein
MKLYYRKKCVLCDTHLLSFTSFLHPIYDCADTNAAWSIQYGYCPHCFSVQLTTLADPLVLYDKNYIQPFQTHLWSQHNLSFVAFIAKHCPPQPLLEIGSSSFCLGKHLIHYYPDYTVFDYSIEQAVKRNDVTYIEGNCEEYQFTHPCIVMSHVFEHLYEPKTFIQNCLRNQVKTILLSVPSMESNQLHVCSQHTFQYNAQDIVYLFGLYEYKLIELVRWNTESFPCFFYCFTLDGPQHVEQILEPRHLYSMQYFQPFRVPPNTFLTTANMFSVVVYPWIENKKDVIGVVDVNPKKHGKKFSYTSLIVQPLEALDQPGNTALILRQKRTLASNIKHAAIMEH